MFACLSLTKGSTLGELGEHAAQFSLFSLSLYINFLIRLNSTMKFLSNSEGPLAAFDSFLFHI